MVNTTLESNRRTKSILWGLGLLSAAAVSPVIANSISNLSFYNPNKEIELTATSTDSNQILTTNGENDSFSLNLDDFDKFIEGLKTQPLKSILTDELKVDEDKPKTETSFPKQVYHTTECKFPEELKPQIVAKFGHYLNVDVVYRGNTSVCIEKRDRKRKDLEAFIRENPNLASLPVNTTNNSTTNRTTVSTQDETKSTLTKEYTADLLKQLKDQGYLDAFIQTYKANGQNVMEKLALGLAESSENESRKANPKNVSKGGYSGFGQVGETNVAKYCNISDKGLVEIVEKAAIDYKNGKRLSDSERLSISARINPVEWNQCYSDFWKKTIDGKYASFKVAIGVHHSGKDSKLFTISEKCKISGGNLLEIDCPSDGHPNFQGLWARTVAHLENMPYALSQVGYDSNGNKLPNKVASQ